VMERACRPEKRRLWMNLLGLVDQSRWQRWPPFFVEFEGVSFDCSCNVKETGGWFSFTRGMETSVCFRSCVIVKTNFYSSLNWNAELLPLCVRFFYKKNKLLYTQCTNRMCVFSWDLGTMLVVYPYHFASSMYVPEWSWPDSVLEFNRQEQARKKERKKERPVRDK
jgi:hypothetical protein